MANTRNTLVILMAVVLLFTPLMPACGSGDNDDGVTTTPTGTAEPTAAPTKSIEPTTPAKDITITIGNITALTGVVAGFLETVNTALKDTVRYFNEEDLIPHVKLDVLEYDAQFDPALDIPAYQFLKDKGVYVMVTNQTNTQMTLKPYVEKDHVLLFGVQAFEEALDPPGWNFNFSHYSTEDAYGLLKWVAENDWDWEANGPAKVGLAEWDLIAGEYLAQGAEAYCQAHPEQFEWVGEHIVPVATFTWATEVDALKDCDYVFAPSAMALLNFAKEYRKASGQAKFLGWEGHLAGVEMWDSGGLWDELDGMIVRKDSMWWNDQSESNALAKELLQRYHSGEADAIMRSGTDYLAVQTWTFLIEIIKKAVETVGTENVDSQALYDAAQSYTVSVDGIDNWGNFSPAKRTFNNYDVFYEVSEADQDLIRISDWLARPTSP